MQKRIQRQKVSRGEYKRKGMAPVTPWNWCNLSSSTLVKSVLFCELPFFFTCTCFHTYMESICMRQTFVSLIWESPICFCLVDKIILTVSGSTFHRHVFYDLVWYLQIINFVSHWSENPICLLSVFSFHYNVFFDLLWSCTIIVFFS